ncbi:ATP-binding domain-containing protein, partial [Acholeplasma sp. OttesenSCG-928-E16]|nr:ATP-binding domain-containing protein [Acholeplasma sp. OttesenSCG-928-E16]
DIAVLYRNNNLSRIIEETFIRSQIPYVIYGGISFFERREIKDILAYIRCSLDYDQSFYMNRIINVPRRKIGLSTVEKIKDKAFSKGITFFEAIDYVDVSLNTKNSLNEFKKIIIDINQKIENEEPLSNLVDDILHIASYKEYLKEEGEEGDERLENVYELKNILSRGEIFYEGTKKEKLRSILDEIALITDLEASIADENRVVLSTYHQVKGLEFKVVFLIAMEEGLFPNMIRLQSELELEEERRVAYVGITRSKERLYVTSSKQRYRYGHVESLNESRFVKEMNAFLKKPTTTFKDNEQSLLKSGDKVSHQMFGDGIVVQIKNKVATIAFKMPHGIKQIACEHPSLRKIN